MQLLVLLTMWSHIMGTMTYSGMVNSTHYARHAMTLISNVWNPG